jgi:hypothetical protein
MMFVFTRIVHRRLLISSCIRGTVVDGSISAYFSVCVFVTMHDKLNAT